MGNLANNLDKMLEAMTDEEFNTWWDEVKNASGVRSGISADDYLEVINAKRIDEPKSTPTHFFELCLNKLGLEKIKEIISDDRYTLQGDRHVYLSY